MRGLLFTFCFVLVILVGTGCNNPDTPLQKDNLQKNLEQQEKSPSGDDKKSEEKK